MTSHLNSHRTTDIKPEMLSGVQTGNGTPHDKYNIRSIAHARTNRKDDIFMQRRLGHQPLVPKRKEKRLVEKAVYLPPPPERQPTTQYTTMMFV